MMNQNETGQLDDTNGRNSGMNNIISPSTLSDDSPEPLTLSEEFQKIIEESRLKENQNQECLRLKKSNEDLMRSQEKNEREIQGLKAIINQLIAGGLTQINPESHTSLEASCDSSQRPMDLHSSQMSSQGEIPVTLSTPSISRDPGLTPKILADTFKSDKNEKETNNSHTETLTDTPIKNINQGDPLIDLNTNDIQIRGEMAKRVVYHNFPTPKIPTFTGSEDTISVHEFTSLLIKYKKALHLSSQEMMESVVPFALSKSASLWFDTVQDNPCMTNFDNIIEALIFEFSGTNY